MSLAERCSGITDTDNTSTVISPPTPCPYSPMSGSEEQMPPLSASRQATSVNLPCLRQSPDEAQDFQVSHYPVTLASMAPMALLSFRPPPLPDLSFLSHHYFSS